MTGEGALPPRPPRCDVTPQNIPVELRELPQWVLWSFDVDVERQRWTKRPKSADGRNASTTNCRTWSSFAAVCSAYDVDRRFDGIGFVFTKDDPFCGIDLDKVIDAQGALAAWALDAVTLLDGYTELSPSRCGLHVIVQAALQGSGRKVTIDARLGHAIEVYDRRRFFCTTGLAYPVMP